MAKGKKIYFRTDVFLLNVNNNIEVKGLDLKKDFGKIIFREFFIFILEWCILLMEVVLSIMS